MAMANARTSLAVSIFVMIIARCISEETCEKVNTCTCKFKNGSTVNLKPVDGGDSPKYTGIDEDQGRTFDWNPCTPFDKGDCKQVLSCQITDQAQNPAGTKDTTFSVDSDGNVVIAYGKSTSGSSERQTKITLKCDPTTNGTKPKGFTGHVVGSLTTYSGTYYSRYCCATGGSSSGRLSAGSVILIIFFPLLLMYFIIGILVNRYGRGIESMPELIPNYSFWADVPFLVKDGVVFTYDRIKTTCAGKCGKSGYAEI